MLSSSRPQQPHGQHQKASEAASASAPPRANQGEGGSVDFVLPDCGLRCAADGHVYSATLHAPLGKSHLINFYLLYIVILCCIVFACLSIDLMIESLFF